MRILFVGPLWQGSTVVQRKVALQDLGHDLCEVDSTPPRWVTKLWVSLPVRILARLGHWLDLAGTNRCVLEAVRVRPYDLLWVDKVLTIAPETLRRLRQEQPGCCLVFHSPDSMLHPRNRSRRYLEGMPLYDLHVTTKSFDVAGLRELGARGVFYIAKGYDPHTHRPMALSPEEQVQWGAQVGFVGGYEEQRYRAIRSIAEAGVDVTVRGPNWQSVVRRVQRNLEVRPGWVYLDNYTRSICATWINLCFLRKSVGDLHTARSIEIPACRAFMLAERTDEHRALFVEGKEAEFFDGEQELIDKIRYYLHHEEERQRIAANGYERCIHSGYSYAERLRPVLDSVRTSG